MALSHLIYSHNKDMPLKQHLLTKVVEDSRIFSLTALTR